MSESPISRKIAGAGTASRQGWQGIARRLLKLSNSARLTLATSVAPAPPHQGVRQAVRQALWPHKLQAEHTAPTPGKLKSLKNSHRHERCFIVGTAPSVRKLALERITDDFIFLVNKGYLLADAFGKRPDAIAFTDPKAFAEYGAEVDLHRYKYVFLKSEIAMTAVPENAYVFRQWHEPRMYEGFVQFDMSKPLYHASTVPLAACQLAMGMGFREIYFIGVDLDYGQGAFHFYKDSESEAQRSARNIDSCKVALMHEGFRELQRQVALRNGPFLANAGVGGKLECLPRIRWDELFPR